MPAPKGHKTSMSVNILSNRHPGQGGGRDKMLVNIDGQYHTQQRDQGSQQITNMLLSMS